MARGMNIKDPEVHRLAAEIARQTGESMTKVVRDALLDRQAQLGQKRKKATALEQGYLARNAYLDYGRGRHAARLNFGDCFVYALAKSLKEPLLFKGTDFHKTDVRAVTA